MFVPGAAQASLTCSQALSMVDRVPAAKLRFTQAFVGRAWAESKVEKLNIGFEAWREANPKGKKATFLAELTSDSPIPAIRDLDGTIRIVDKHHTFYAMVLFNGKSLGFNVNVKMVKDYSAGRKPPLERLPWTRELVIQDMVNDAFLGKISSGDPQYRWLQQLPHNILELGDLPMRSLMSFLMGSFPIQLKGRDFLPHFQNNLAKKIMELGLEPFSENSYGPENLTRLRKMILEHEDLRQFVIEQIDPSISEIRRGEILDFLSA